MSKSNMLQSFVNKNLGEVRLFIEDGNIWFLAVDLLKILQVGNTTKTLSRLRDDEKMTFTIGKGHKGGAQYMRAVNEYGLWRLVFTSRSDSAEKLQIWLSHDVLPSIRKNGGYIEGQENLDPEELAALRKEISSLRKKVAKRDFRIASLESDVEELEDQVSILKKQEYANAYSLYSNEDTHIFSRY